MKVTTFLRFLKFSLNNNSSNATLRFGKTHEKSIFLFAGVKRKDTKYVKSFLLL